MAPSDKSELKDAIIEVSLLLGTELGEEGLTMRAIAKRLGVSATALYQHFDSKAAILRGIRMYGLQALDAALVPASELADPLDGLIDEGIRYVRFARENPWLYSVLVEHESLVWDDLGEHEREVLLASQNRTGELIGRAIQAGRLRPDLDPMVARLLMWAAIHGLASLMIGGRISARHPVFPVQDEDAFVRSFVRNLLRGYEP